VDVKPAISMDVSHVKLASISVLSLVRPVITLSRIVWFAQKQCALNAIMDSILTLECVLFALIPSLAVLLVIAMRFVINVILAII
jgi:hypothetical protein